MVKGMVKNEQFMAERIAKNEQSYVKEWPKMSIPMLMRMPSI